MNRLLFIILLTCSAYTFAGQESYQVSFEYTTKTHNNYDASDIVLASSGTLFATGVIYYFTASQTVGMVSMTAGGVGVLVGVIMKISRKNGNRRG